MLPLVPKAGAAGEIGHVTVDPEGYLCTCGKRGCLEQYASATGVVHVARDMAEEFSGDSELKRQTDDGQDITSKLVFDLAKEGDVLALRVVDRVCYMLGLALGNLANTLNPESIVIGGGVRDNFEKFAFSTVRSSTQLKLARLGNDAGVIGAASLARVFA